MRKIVFATLMLAIFPASTFAANVEMPSNVTTVPGTGKNRHIDTIDFSFAPTQVIEFSKLKLCIAENMTNNAVTLSDSSGSFVGPATGHYYSNDRSQTVQGGGIFKYLDDSTSVLIANGTTDGGTSSWGLIRDILKFDLKAAVNAESITLRYSNITRAQQDTGISTNDGFHAVGTWKGARPKQVYGALELLANRIKACISSA